MASADIKKQRLQIPLMFAFRDAFTKGDALKSEDIRLDGERVLTDRNSLRRGASESVLKRDLATDLSSLTDTISLGSALDLADLPYVAKSVLNFGLPDLSRMTVDDATIDALGNRLKTALLSHEPRLSANSLTVQRGEEGDDVNQRVRFKVRADLISRPLDIPVEFVAEVDIAAGKVSLPRLLGAT